MHEEKQKQKNLLQKTFYMTLNQGGAQYLNKTEKLWQISECTDLNRKTRGRTEMVKYVVYNVDEESRM